MIRSSPHDNQPRNYDAAESCSQFAHEEINDCMKFKVVAYQTVCSLQYNSYEPFSSLIWLYLFKQAPGMVQLRCSCCSCSVNPEWLLYIFLLKQWLAWGRGKIPKQSKQTLWVHESHMKLELWWLSLYCGVSTLSSHGLINFSKVCHNFELQTFSVDLKALMCMYICLHMVVILFF